MKKILFLTGTRADFGKIKSLINITEKDSDFKAYVFVTGMHMHALYGSTYKEIEVCNYKNIYKYINQTSETSMDLTLAKTIEGLSSFIKEFPIDLLVVHGDRVEALAGAIVGSLNNILVAHIEGGELSGTIDELIRHAISKMSHIHFVSNNKAKKRLMQLGESENTIFEIGSPDMDLMFSNKLPTISEVKSYYDIFFEKYSVVLYHPVTTEYQQTEDNANQFVDALIEDKKNYIVIYPNNDLGSGLILRAYKRLQNNPRFRIFPSIRFEYFLTLLKESDFIIGNSSAGIREAPAYGVQSINIGTRQNNRAQHASIINCSVKREDILHAINKVNKKKIYSEMLFGKGKSDILFHEILKDYKFWNISTQKIFNDINL